VLRSKSTVTTSRTTLAAAGQVIAVCLLSFDGQTCGLPGGRVWREREGGVAVVNANANATGLGRGERPNTNTGQGRESEGPTQAISVAGGKVFAHQKVGRLSSEYVLVLYVSAFGCEAGNDFDNLLEPFFHMRFHMRTTGTELPINRPAITRLHWRARFDDDGPQLLCIPHCCVHFPIRACKRM
jgi:hypothetical protein